MKIKITTLILSLITSISFAQLTFVKEITGYYEIHPPISYVSIEIETANYIENGKYFLAKRINENVAEDFNFDYEILDKNYNLYKQLKLDTSNNTIGGRLVIDSRPILSDHLFNTDDKMEFWYSLYSSSNGQVLRTIIADEDNNILMILEGESFRSDNFYIMDGKTYIATRKGNRQNYTSKIYEVAGNLPCIQCNSKTTNTNTTQTPAPNYAFKIFPNPTDGQLNIESDLDELNMQIKIYSTSGQLLQTDPFFYGTNSVNVSSLASGTYVINIVSDKGFLHTEKFVKR
jgi:hypothetical protein